MQAGNGIEEKMASWEREEYQLEGGRLRITFQDVGRRREKAGERLIMEL